MTSRIEVVQGDITKIKADAIVNAANSALLGGGGVDGAIHSAGGKIILEECMAYVSANGRLPVGKAMITSGGMLPAKYVIHTVGPIWNGGKNNEDELLKSAYLGSLQLGVANNIRSIAFPNISTGIYHFPKEKAVAIAVDTVKLFLKNDLSIEKLLFVCFDDDNYELYQSKLRT
ncbi:MAG: O-acetyl-ADP-ribose deacetylase [Chitinophagales bacterium]|nr:O-acetyl-ADP-ribose deacetylase [Chitinophagales bacterium]